ncbi:MAG TPA: tRNA 2-thiouridine(34) synthase MnmA [Chitinivibrionales bacterium]
MKIAVGLSGGVDSAVTALLLKQAGHDVIGTTMKIWDGRKTSHAKGNACYGPDEQEDIREAFNVCKLLEIPYHVIDCSQQYNEIVLKYFDEEYRAGRTPNPCVACNEKIKFGMLPLMLEQSGVHFERFATGHYAITDFDRVIARYLLKKGKDPKKDQSYFLYRLSQTQLAKVMFPLGGYSKEQVRALAREAKLPVHDKKESQDFYSGDYTELLSVKNGGGAIVDTHGNFLGNHDGYCNFTIGQRKGLGVAGGVPLYVVAVRPRTNEVVLGEKELLFARGLRATDVTIIAGTMPLRAWVKTRSASDPEPCTITFDGIELEIMFDTPHFAVTPGQSAVVYDGDMVIGGGIIKEAIL